MQDFEPDKYPSVVSQAKQTDVLSPNDIGAVLSVAFQVAALPEPAYIISRTLTHWGILQSGATAAAVGDVIT